MVFHLPATPGHKADIRPLLTIEGTTSDWQFFQDVDLVAGNLTITD